MVKEMFLINNKKDSKNILIFWLLSIFSILLITTLGNYFLDSYLFNMESLFDIKHYLSIAQNGYIIEKELAFFPFVPLLMKVFDLINIPIIGMVILNNLVCLLSTYLIYNISTDIYETKNSTALTLCILWLFSPIRVFTFVPYTEALFMFFCLIAFYLYKKRLSPILLGIAMGLSVVTRSMGAIVFFVIFTYLFIEMIRGKNKDCKKDKFNYILKAYVPATIISCLYPIYLQIKVGSWKYFIDVQYEYWGRVKGNIFQVLAFDAKRIIETTNFEVFLMILLTFISLIVVVMLVVDTLSNSKLKKLDLILILVISIITMFSTYRDIGISAGSTSFFRYIYGLMPMCLLIDDNTNKIIKAILLAISISLFVLVTFMFLANKFLA